VERVPLAQRRLCQAYHPPAAMPLRCRGVALARVEAVKARTAPPVPIPEPRAAAATVVPPAEAQEKMSQAVAKYQGTPKGDQRCDGCMLFQPPNACKVVEGEISPSGWCQLFVKKT
jgi:hypothetical protein